MMAVKDERLLAQCQLYFARGYFCKEKLLIVARIVSFDTLGLHLYILTFRILEPYQCKDILTLIILS